VNARPASADWRPLHGILFFALVAITMQVPQLRIWPLLWVIPLAAYLAFVAITPPLRATFFRWRFGRVTPFAACAAAIISLCTVVTLIAFHHFAHPDVSGYRTMLPVQWFGGVVATGIIFPLLERFRKYCSRFWSSGVDALREMIEFVRLYNYLNRSKCRV
jgi:hypothetical protein